MKVLFVSAGVGAENKPSPFILSQGQSLIDEGVDLKYFFYEGGSVKHYLSAIPKLRAKVQEFLPDVIHAHYSFSGFVCRFQLKAPVVLSLLGSDVYTENLKEDFIKKFVVSFSNALIVKSKRMKEKLGVKTSVIPNGVDLKTFFPIEKNKAREICGLEKDKVYFLFASNPQREEKNFPLAEDLVQKIKAKNLNAELIFLHKKTQKELNEFYNAVDFLLLTSNHEGSPNVVKEALATNLPVISTDVGDVSERIEGVRNSYLLTKNLEKDSNGVLKIMKNYSRSNGREKVQGIEISVIAKKIINVYEEVLK